MDEGWSERIVGQMFGKKLTGRRLAELTGFTPEYVSKVLHGHKGNEKTRRKLDEAVAQYVPPRNEGGQMF